MFLILSATICSEMRRRCPQGCAPRFRASSAVSGASMTRRALRSTPSRCSSRWSHDFRGSKARSSRTRTSSCARCSAPFPTSSRPRASPRAPRAAPPKRTPSTVTLAAATARPRSAGAASVSPSDWTLSSTCSCTCRPWQDSRSGPWASPRRRCRGIRTHRRTSTPTARVRTAAARAGGRRRRAARRRTPPCRSPPRSRRSRSWAASGARLAIARRPWKTPSCTSSRSS
mmetsp:Transcript_24639/g.82490  ORF Transcript_24639/g.82490 Transcript_24639/m.82490 type:complete len:229 (-) Transcript_24639:1344-2030(-)